MRELYLSKDMSRLPELITFGENPKFLDNTEKMTGNNIAFASFPRTGNSFLRKFIEQSTGLWTGSNMPNYVTSLLQFGTPMPAEGHYAND